MRRWYRWIGAVLLIAGCGGMLTVADDLRHTGELAGVGGVTCAAVCLLVAGSENRISRRFALQWVAVGIGVGLLAGAAADNMLLGVGGGAAIGALLAAVSAPRRGPLEKGGAGQ